MDGEDSVTRGCVRYRCTHVTRYDYGDTVISAHMLAHLAPRAHPRQTNHNADLTVLPRPGVMTSRSDWFGNPVTYAALHTPHRELKVTAEIDVTVAPRPPSRPMRRRPGKRSRPRRQVWLKPLNSCGRRHACRWPIRR